MKTRAVRCAFTLGLAIVLTAATSEAWAAPARWRKQDSPSPGLAQSVLYGVTTTSPTNAFAVGCYADSAAACSNGLGLNGLALIEHYDGSTWQRGGAIHLGDASTLRAVRATSAGNAWAVGSWVPTGSPALTFIEHWDGSRWTRQTSVNFKNRTNLLYGLAAASATDAWAVGGATDYVHGKATLPIAEHYDGTKWTMVRTGLPSAAFLEDVTVLGPSNVWAVGGVADDMGITYPLSEHWDGTSWSGAAFPSAGVLLTGIGAASSSDFWAVGNLAASGMIYHSSDGVHWNQYLACQCNLTGVKVLASNDVWFAGYSTPPLMPQRTMLIHWNGTNLREKSSPDAGPGDNELQAIGASSSSNLFAVGMHFDADSVGRTLVIHCC